MSYLDDYLATVAPPQRDELERVRAIAKETVPSAEEGVSYAVPALKYRGKPFLGFIAAKRHLSLYPFSGKVIESLRDQLAGYETTSGSIHFSAENPLPEALLREIIAARLREIEKPA